MYAYAQASLLHYAEWMLEHEVPYATVLDKVEIPTETWPAQDLRKSAILHLAAQYITGPLQSALHEKAEFFFQTCIRDLQTYPTCTLTRPIVLLMTNAHVHSYFQVHREKKTPRAEGQYDFGQPRRFSSQFSELYRVKDKLAEWIQAVKGAKRHIRYAMRKGQSLSGVHRG
jgi:hypothetical protein